jgi:ribosomal protein S18 acetylase RimI-like enzyme
MDEVRIVKADIKYARSFNRAVASVTKEKIFLATVTTFPLDSTISFVQKIIENNYTQFYAIENNEVIGWCDIQPKGFDVMKHVGVLGIGVVSSHRHRGIGSRLLEAAIDNAKEKCLEKVELEVFASNTNAIKLYKKFGFQFEGKRIQAKKLEGIYDDIVLMGLIF